MLWWVNVKIIMRDSSLRMISLIIILLLISSWLVNRTAWQWSLLFSSLLFITNLLNNATLSTWLGITLLSLSLLLIFVLLQCVLNLILQRDVILFMCSDWSCWLVYFQFTWKHLLCVLVILTKESSWQAHSRMVIWMLNWW